MDIANTAVYACKRIFCGGGQNTKLLKKAQYYLIPFVSCFVISEVLIRGHYDLLNSFYHLIFHLESSLWYLFVLFELSVVHFFAATVAGKLPKNTTMGYIVKYTVFYGVFLIPFVLLAKFFGTTFLGCKYVLYYSLFFYLGHMWQKIALEVKNLDDKKRLNVEKIVNIFTLFALVLYVVIVANVNTFETADNFMGIIPRFGASICGLIVVVKMVFAAYKEENVIVRGLNLIGQYTLEIYYIHYLFIKYIVDIKYPLFSVEGMFSVTFYYVAVLLICAVGILVINSSPYSSLIILGRGKKNGGK